MKTGRFLKSTVALLLILGILCGFVPASFPDWMQTVHARAEQEAENRAITRAVIRSLNASFEPIMALAAEAKEAGGERADGLWRYVLIEDKNWAVITGHADAAATALKVPQTLGGADVVGLAESALADHSQLLKIDLPGNLNAIADGAIPMGTTIRGYNASFAQHYAEQARYPFETLSAYDFIEGVVDFGDIQVGQFVRYSQYSLSLRDLEAMRLAVGSRFFLIDPQNPYQISYYKVTEMNDYGSGFVDIACSTPDIDELMYSYSGVNEAMALDLSTLQLGTGVSLDYGNATGSKSRSGSTLFDVTPSVAVEIPFTIKNSWKLPTGDKLTLDASIKHAITVTYKGSLWTSKEMTIKDVEEVSISGTVSKKIYGNQEGYGTIEGENELGHYEGVDPNRLKNEIVNWLKVVNDEDWTGKNDIKIPLGSGWVASYAGIVNIAFQLDIVVELNGSATISASWKTTSTTYSDSNGNKTKETVRDQPVFNLQGALNGKLGVEAKLIGCLTCVKCVEIAGFIGLTIAIKTPNLLDFDAGTVNLADCITITVTLLAEGSIHAGLLGIVSFDASPIVENQNVSIGAKVTFFKEEFPIMHYHILSRQFHFETDCPYSLSATFQLPVYNEKISKFFIFDVISALGNGNQIEEPDVGELKKFYEEKYNLSEWIRFDGWYLDENFSGNPVSFPFTMGDEKVTFYGKVYNGPHVKTTSKK